MAGWSSLRRAALAALLPIAALWSPAGAQAEPSAVTQPALEAVGRALGFVESLPRDTVRLGVVYEPGLAGAAEDAARVATAMGSLSGQGIPPLQAAPVAADRVGSLGPAGGATGPDVLFVMPGASAGHGPGIADAVRQQHLISVSIDPACLEANCCVLFVQAEPRVDIVIDTAMARAAGARFSLIFAAMVRRK